MKIFFLKFFLAFELFKSSEAACSLAERRASIPQMKIQRPNPGMYYAVDTSKRKHEDIECPAGTLPATIRDIEEWWDYFWLDQGEFYLLRITTNFVCPFHESSVQFNYSIFH